MSAAVGPGTEYDIIFDPRRGFLGSYVKDAPPGSKFTSSQFLKNIESLMTSIIAYAQYKALKYQENSPSKDLDELMKSLEAKKRILEDRRPKNVGGLGEKGLSQIESKTVEDTQKQYATIINNLSKFQSKEQSNKDIIVEYCQYLKLSKDQQQLFREKVAVRIANSILNLRSEVSGDSTSAKETRKQIEKYVIDFSNSWRSFQGSYILNYCLTGGAGVGKTTLAKAISKCFAAFGILATDYIKEANKTDFIAEYVGQSVAKTQETLYTSLEGVCFIDEAYAVGQVELFGQEFLDELTFFTQKFPGCICIIVAGYEKEMKQHFFDKNEGLNRRFPNRVDLKPYDISTIKNTLISRVLTKLRIPSQNKAVVERSLMYHLLLLQMLYMDTHQSFSEYIAVSSLVAVDFNLVAILKPLYEGSSSIQKKSILKTYILKRWFNIPEGDLFPNQMGDIQNIVDFVLRLEPVIQAGTVSLQDAVNTINSYFAIRKSAQLLVREVPTAENDPKKINVLFTLPKRSPEDFTASILDPLYAQLSTPESIDAFYTEAILYLQAYQDRVVEGKETVKLSTHVDPGFLKQEYDRLERDRQKLSTATLSYASAEAESEEANLSEFQSGKFPVIVKETLQSVCKEVVTIPEGADIRNADDGAGVSSVPSGGPVGAGAGPKLPAIPPLPVSAPQEGIVEINNGVFVRVDHTKQAGDLYKITAKGSKIADGFFVPEGSPEPFKLKGTYSVRFYPSLAGDVSLDGYYYPFNEENIDLATTKQYTLDELKKDLGVALNVGRGNGAGQAPPANLNRPPSTLANVLANAVTYMPFQAIYHPRDPSQNLFYPVVIAFKNTGTSIWLRGEGEEAYLYDPTTGTFLASVQVAAESPGDKRVPKGDSRIEIVGRGAQGGRGFDAFTGEIQGVTGRWLAEKGFQQPYQAKSAVGWQGGRRRLTRKQQKKVQRKTRYRKH